MSDTKTLEILRGIVARWNAGMSAARAMDGIANTLIVAESDKPTNEPASEPSAPEKKPLIVEVDEFTGEDTSIICFDGKPVFCIGMRGNDGVIRFVDYGYRNAQEAKEAWGEAEYLPGRGV